MDHDSGYEPLYTVIHQQDPQRGEDLLYQLSKYYLLEKDLYADNRMYQKPVPLIL